MTEFNTGILIAGRYRLEHQVGQGGMGSVWVAEDEKLERWVAVKLLGEQCASSRSARERFEREAMAIAKLRSPHVVQVFDYGTDGGQAYMVMELLNGEDLYAWLRSNRGVSLRKVVAIVVQIARALSAAHRAGIVHRDLKPANVFVVKDHEEEIVKVFDFGLAKGVEEGGPLRELRDQTGEGVLLGTPRYMSPEQAHGAKRVDHRSDLWSLAVIAYLAITSRMPFDGKGVGEIITKIVTEPHVPPTRYVAALPSAVDEFFDRAFGKEPDDRFESAHEFADAFDDLLSDARLSRDLLAADTSDTITELEALDQADTELGSRERPRAAIVSGSGDASPDEESSGATDDAAAGAPESMPDPVLVERGPSLIPIRRRRFGRWAGAAALAAAAALGGFLVARTPTRVEAVGGRVAPVVFPAIPVDGRGDDPEIGDGEGSPADDEGADKANGSSAGGREAAAGETADSDAKQDSNDEQVEGDDAPEDDAQADADGESAPAASADRGLELFDDRH